MNFSRQALLGIGMIIGGSVMLYAMAQQIGTNDKPLPVATTVQQTTTESVAAKPLTTDIDTEKRILAQKQKQRAARVAEQEKRTKQFLAEQEAAEEQALAKARSENQRYVDNTTTTGGDSDSPEAAQNTVATPTVQLRPDAEKTATETADETKKADKIKAEEEAAKKVAAEKEKIEKDKKVEENKKQEKAEKQAEADSKKQAKEDEKAKADKKAKDEADKKAKAEEKAAADKKKADKKAWKF